jgi:hypothetical protein
MGSAMATVGASTDAAVLRDFRDLFRLTLDEVEATGLSRSTWARIEASETADRRPGVVKRLRVFRTLLEYVGRMPYSEARAWAIRPLPHRRKTPRDVILSGLGGCNYLIAELVGREEHVG